MPQFHVHRETLLAIAPSDPFWPEALILTLLGYVIPQGRWGTGECTPDGDTPATATATGPPLSHDTAD
jgi:hypothetical protein